MSATDHTTFNFFSTTQNIWLAKSLKKLGCRVFKITALAEHADTRRYLRIHTSNKNIICLQTTGNHNLKNFILTSQDLAYKGIPVPTILDYDLNHGLALLTDFGDLSLLKAIQVHTSQKLFLYEKAIDLIHQLQNTQPANLKPPYTEQLARKNMQLCVDWYCEKLCKNPLSPHEQKLWQEVTHTIAQNWTDIPTGVCHRDFHADNLMVTGNPHHPQLHLLDYQDLSYGPYLYDLASLVTDHYLPANQDKKTQLLEKALNRLTVSQKPTASTTQQATWLGILCYQRNLKNLGVFSRLSLTQKKNHFLNNIPRMFANLREIPNLTPPFYELAECLWHKHSKH